MAMAEPSRSQTPSGPEAAIGGAPRRRSRQWLAWLLLALGVAAIWFGGTAGSYGVAGASYAAQVGCSCRYIGGRSLGSCRDDFEKGMGLIVLTEDSDARSVTARFPLLSTQTATFRDGQGCVLERWKD